MKFLSEYRNAGSVHKLIELIHRNTTRDWRIMEVCGGQTNTILRYGLDQSLRSCITFVHGPGCPVCVTPAETIDLAQTLATRPDVILCSFGDMLRVPGSKHTLLDIKSVGGDVVMLYSPLDALRLAQERPGSEVVFFGIGFETTAPLTALAILQAKEVGLRNFSVLCAHVLIPPAVDAVLQMPSARIDALLAPGHVCTISGIRAYQLLSAQHKIPIVVTGFEPVDILQGVLQSVEMLEQDRAEVAIQYRRAVAATGNPEAQRLAETVFRPADREWRGLGMIPDSGLVIAREFQQYDAEHRFTLKRANICSAHSEPCGDILTGHATPPECPLFGRQCTPEHPVGAPMVSSEGTCAAYYRSQRYAATASTVIEDAPRTR